MLQLLFSKEDVNFNIPASVETSIVNEDVRSIPLKRIFSIPLL